MTPARTTRRHVMHGNQWRHRHHCRNGEDRSKVREYWRIPRTPSISLRTLRCGTSRVRKATRDRFCFTNQPSHRACTPPSFTARCRTTTRLFSMEADIFMAARRRAGTGADVVSAAMTASSDSTSTSVFKPTMFSHSRSSPTERHKPKRN